MSASVCVHGGWLLWTVLPGFPHPLALGWVWPMEGTGGRFESEKRYKPRYCLPAQAVAVSLHDSSSCWSGASPWLQLPLGSENIIYFPARAASLDVSLQLPQNSSFFIVSLILATLKKKIISLKSLILLFAGTLKIY